MPLLPVANDWGRLLDLLVFVLGFVLVLPVSEPAEVNAQSQTRLTLIDQISEPGASAVKGQPLPAGTQVVILFEEVVSDETKSDFSTLLNLDLSHPELAQRIQTDRFQKTHLREGGKTDLEIGKTDGSNQIYYLLARTGEGNLYESYVNAGDRGFRPGFDAVQSGDMKMGQVPEEHRDTLRAALESVFSTGNSGGGGKSTSPSEESGESPVTDGGRDAGNMSYLQWALGFLPEGGAWSAVFIFLFGVVTSGLGTWIVMRKRIKSVMSKSKSRKKLIKKLKVDLHNEKKKPVSSKRSENKNINSEEEIEEIKRSKNRKIRRLKNELENKNSKIKDLKNEIKGKNKLQKESNYWKEKSSGRDTRDIDSTGRRQSDSGSNESKATGDRTINAVSQAFLRWCTDKGAAMRDRHTMFAKELKDRLPGAELQRIFREKNAAGIVFAEDAQDAVEYWLVRADGRDLLLPQPQRSGFREVDKCFEVENRSPDEIQEFLPAELQSQGGKYKLQSKGMVA